MTLSDRTTPVAAMDGRGRAPEGGELMALRGPDGVRFQHLPAAHLAAATAHAQEFLTGAGLRGGDTALLAGRVDATAVFRPFAQALTALGCPHLVASAGRFARPNLVAFFRHFELRLVAGLGTDLLDELDALGLGIRDVFGDAVVYASAAAQERIGDPAVRAWRQLGPIAAVGCPEADRVHLISGDVLPVVDADGRLTLLVDGVRLDTGYLAEPSVEGCGCGVPSLPRYRLAGPAAEAA